MSANIPDTPLTLLKKLTAESATEPQWHHFITLYTPVIRSWLKYTPLPASDHEDALQDIFVRLVKTLRSQSYNEARGHFRSFLAYVVKNTTIDYLRKKENLQNHLHPTDPLQMENLPAPHVAIPFQVDVQFRLARLDAAITTLQSDPTLTPIYREVLEKCIIQGLPPIAIAKSTGFSYQHLYRIQKKLRKLIQKRSELWNI